MKLHRPMAIAVLVALATISATAADVPDGASGQLTLGDAVATALQHNPQTRMATASRDSAVWKNREAQSAWLPRISVSETMARSDNPVFVFGSLLEQGRFAPQYFDPAFLNNPPAMRNWRGALNIQYTIFDQLRRFDSGRQASNGVQQADFASEEARQRVRLETMSRYYGLVVAMARRNVAAEAARAAEADAKAMRDKFAQGLLVESDALAAEVQLADFQQQEISAEGDVATARAALNVTLGRPFDAPLEVVTTLPAKTFPELPLGDSVAQGLKARNDIRSAAKQSENAALGLQMARGSLLPRLDAFATLGASGAHLHDRNGDQTVGVMASFDVFDGGKLARLGQAKAGLEAARAGESAARDGAAVEIVSAWQRVQSARQRVEVASRAVERAEAASRIVHDRYDQGLTTITEQLRASTAVVGARLSLLAARYDYVIGYADLLRATGGLHDVEPFV